MTTISISCVHSNNNKARDGRVTTGNVITRWEHMCTSDVVYLHRGGKQDQTPKQNKERRLVCAEGKRRRRKLRGAQGTSGRTHSPSAQQGTPSPHPAPARPPLPLTNCVKQFFVCMSLQCQLKSKQQGWVVGDELSNVLSFPNSSS